LPPPPALDFWVALPELDLLLLLPQAATPITEKAAATAAATNLVLLACMFSS
jgi:hypothetical protein